MLEAGMVTTDEPGIYIEGKYGIRTENELVCRKGTENQYGQFMEFEILTLTPVDLDGILPEEMTEQERAGSMPTTRESMRNWRRICRKKSRHGFGTAQGRSEKTDYAPVLGGLLRKCRNCPVRLCCFRIDKHRGRAL